VPFGSALSAPTNNEADEAVTPPPVAPTVPEARPQLDPVHDGIEAPQPPASVEPSDTPDSATAPEGSSSALNATANAASKDTAAEGEDAVVGAVESARDEAFAERAPAMHAATGRTVRRFRRPTRQ